MVEKFNYCIAKYEGDYHVMREGHDVTLNVVVWTPYLNCGGYEQGAKKAKLLVEKLTHECPKQPMTMQEAQTNNGPWVNKDGTINIGNPEVLKALQDMGWGGCLQDNDCACSNAQHKRDNAIEKLFIKIHG